MSLSIEFLSGAGADLETIFEQFEGYREGFGVELLALVNAKIGYLADFPQSARRYVGSVRRQVMQVFPYGIFYQAQSRRILVIAILDLQQDERAILRRIGSEAL